MLKKYKTVLTDVLPSKENMESDVIYFSEQKQRSTHLCPCECGEEIYLSHYRGGWMCYLDDKEQMNITTRIENVKCDTYYTIHSGYAFSQI